MNCQPLPVSIPPSLRRALLLTLAAASPGPELPPKRTGADAPTRPAPPELGARRRSLVRWAPDPARQSLYRRRRLRRQEARQVNRKMDLRGQVLVPPLAEGSQPQPAKRPGAGGSLRSATSTKACSTPPCSVATRPAWPRCAPGQPASDARRQLRDRLRHVQRRLPAGDLVQGREPRHRPPATAAGAARHPEQLEAQWPAIRERAAGGMIRAVLAPP